MQGIVTIIVEASDDDGIDRVEFYVNYLLAFTDLELHYEYDLNIDWSNSYYFNIINYQLCSSYHFCIENYIGEQDLFNCD